MFFIHCRKLFSNTEKSVNYIIKQYSTSNSFTRIDFTNGIKRISMCNPKTRNALSLEMMQNLTEHINTDQNNPDLRVIVLSGDGPVFSAGHNLKELTKEVGRTQHEQVFRASTKLMCTIIDSSVPIIARVEGLAAAAGCQLVSQCDIVVCSNKSTFSTPGANFGIFCSTPGVGLSRSVNKTTAMHMLLTGLPITSDEAKLCGLVTKVCESEELDKEIDAICEAIKSKSRSVIELGKRFYYKQIQMDVKQAYEIGGDTMVENLQLQDGKEGIQSFVEKRKAIWSHKSD